MPPATTDDRSIRDAILEMLTDGMDELSAAIDTADPATPEEEELQLRRYHELGYLANQYRKLQRDIELDEMDERIDVLKKKFDSCCRTNT